MKRDECKSSQDAAPCIVVNLNNSVDTTNSFASNISPRYNSVSFTVSDMKNTQSELTNDLIENILVS